MVTFFRFTRHFIVSEEIFFEAGQRIANLRGKLTQAGFAQRLGVSRKTVEGWEAGHVLPNGNSLLRMREAFGADINVILTGQAGGVAPTLRPDEEELLANYRQANSDGRERIRQISATAANAPKRGEAKEKPRTVVHIGVMHGNQIDAPGENITLEGNTYNIGSPPPAPTKKASKK